MRLLGASGKCDSEIVAFLLCLQVISGISSIDAADAFARALVLSYYQGRPQQLMPCAAL